MSSRADINAALRKLGKIAPVRLSSSALHIRFAAPLIQFQTYSEELVGSLFAKRPTRCATRSIAWGFSTTGAARWSDAADPRPVRHLREAGVRHGLLSALTVSLRPDHARGPSPGFARTTASSRMPRSRTSRGDRPGICMTSTEPPDEPHAGSDRRAAPDRRGRPPRGGGRQARHLRKRAQGAARPPRARRLLAHAPRPRRCKGRRTTG